MTAIELETIGEGHRLDVKQAIEAEGRARRHRIDANRAVAEAAVARLKVMEPVLRELPSLSLRKVAAKLEQRGFGRVSYKTVERARRRLGLPSKAAELEKAQKIDDE